MNRITITVSAVAALLVLGGCGADTSTTEPVPDSTISSATTTSSSPSPPPSSPTPSSPAPSTPTASVSSAPSPSGVLSLTESCRAVLDDQQDAVAALRNYVRNPLAGDVSAKDLDRLRSELLAGELSAPEPLRQELNTQVGVLNSVVQGIQDGNVQQVDIGSFQDAQQRITSLCADAGR